MTARKLVVISNCTRRCPHVRIRRTPRAGRAEDYLCSRTKPDDDQRDHRDVGRLIVGYVEWDDELPKDGVFPDWCPLQEAEEGMYLDQGGARHG